MVFCLSLAFLKQQGQVKGLKNNAVNEEIPHLLEGGGKMEVGYININVNELINIMSNQNSKIISFKMQFYFLSNFRYG